MPPQHMLVTRRDAAMFATIGTARYLTADAIEWLHYPTWRTRWEAWQTTKPQERYEPTPNLYRRLNYWVNEGLLGRITRSAQTGSRNFGREPSLYYLTREGLEVAMMCGAAQPEEIDVPRMRTRSIAQLNHSAMIGRFYAAMQAKVKMRADLKMTDWRGDHQIARAYDRVKVGRIGKHGNAELVTLPILPDATFVLHHAKGSIRVFVEIDRGTRAVETWMDKIHAYDRYARSPELPARYGCTSFMVLAVTTTETQCRKLMQATASVLGKAHGWYLFALEGSVHPTTIGSDWLRITEVTPSKQKYRPQITVEELVWIG